MPIGLPIDKSSRYAENIGMKPHDLLTVFANKTEIARVLGVQPPSVHEWFADGEIPETRQYQIEIVTSGALKADKPANRKPGPIASPSS